MMGMGIKRMVKFLKDKQPEDVIIPRLVHIKEEGKETGTCVEIYRQRGTHGISINAEDSDALEHTHII